MCWPKRTGLPINAQGGSERGKHLQKECRKSIFVLTVPKRKPTFEARSNYKVQRKETTYIAKRIAGWMSMAEERDISNLGLAFARDECGLLMMMVKRRYREGQAD